MPANTHPDLRLDNQTLQVLWRGATKRCGVCGRRRGLFRRWVIMADDCPRCGLTFERTEGHYIGAVGINTIVSFGLLVLLLSAFFTSTYPDIPAGPWVFGAAAIYGLVPVFYYPISKTLWTAIDLLMRPLEPGEVRHPDDWEWPERPVSAANRSGRWQAWIRRVPPIRSAPERLWGQVTRKRESGV